MTAPSSIEVAELTKHYGEIHAVRGISFHTKANGIACFLGRNGAGKSTTIKMLLGMVRPTSGKAHVLGYRIDDERQSVLIRRSVAYVGEDKGLYHYMTVAQIIRFTRAFYDTWQSDIEKKLLKEYDLRSNQTVKSLSKGMRTKLALLLAFARQPRLLILDEPTEGLDPVSIEEHLQAVREISSKGTSVFFSSHQLGEVERIADHVLMIDRGELVLDRPIHALRKDFYAVRARFETESQLQRLRAGGVHRMRQEGSQVVILAESNVQDVVERVRAMGSSSVEVAPADLREIFLQTVRT
jgi:ABC-2 type transport system ATP-binding protein